MCFTFELFLYFLVLTLRGIFLNVFIYFLCVYFWQKQVNQDEKNISQKKNTRTRVRMLKRDTIQADSNTQKNNNNKPNFEPDLILEPFSQNKSNSEPAQRQSYIQQRAAEGLCLYYIQFGFIFRVLLHCSGLFWRNSLTLAHRRLQKWLHRIL